MSVIAGRASTGGEPAPNTPEPPDYTACIAYQRAHWPRLPQDQSAPTSKVLKSECELIYRREKLKALYFLISYRWATGEGAELGVKLHKQEVKRELAKFESLAAPNAAAFRRYLTVTRATIPDIVLSVELGLLTTKIQQKLEAAFVARGLTAQARQQSLDEFGQAFERRWRSRTDCRPGYVVPICSAYKPPKTPPTLVPPSVPLTNMAVE